MASFPKEKPAPRITVVDSLELDKEVYTYLKKEILVDKFIPTKCLNNFEPELDALLKYIIWKFSISNRNATFGQQFQHLKYSRTSSQHNLKKLAILNIGGKYVKEKFNNILPLFDQNSLIINRYFRYLETFYYLLNFLSFVSFVRNGGSSTWQENILKVCPVSTVPLSSRNIRHSSMTREFLWHSCIETFLLLIPLINYTKIKRRLDKMLGRTKPNSSEILNPSELNMKCASCNESPILPHQLGCSHIFCYYCFTSNSLADPGYECPICGYSKLETVKPLNFRDWNPMKNLFVTENNEI